MRDMSGLHRGVCLKAVIILLWTHLHVCCGWDDLSFKSQRGSKIDVKKFEGPSMPSKAGAPFSLSTSTLSVPVSADQRTMSLLETDLSQSKQKRKRKDDILGSDDESDDAASASGDSSDSYGINASVMNFEIVVVSFVIC
jgi:hypothetical protein